MLGHNITVTAVYEYGESGHTEFVNVYVSGKCDVHGKLLEIDGTTALSGGEVIFVGRDEFNISRTYRVTVNANGEYSESIYVGDYQNSTQEVELTYGQDMTLNFLMYEDYQTVKNVVATELSNSVKVEWEMDERAFTSYNVYRTNIHGDIIEPLVKNITETTYNDNEWTSLEPGTYKWGVSAVYDGNRAEQVILEETFESGVMPSGWTTYQEPESEYYISDWGVKNSSYNYYAFDGSYSAFSQGSPSTSSYYMVTSAIDLSICTNVNLRFQYVTPAWDTDVNILKVKSLIILKVLGQKYGRHKVLTCQHGQKLTLIFQSMLRKKHTSLSLMKIIMATALVSTI